MCRSWWSMQTGSAFSVLISGQNSNMLLLISVVLSATLYAIKLAKMLNKLQVVLKD